jgi:hypothetical protein
MKKEYTPLVIIVLMKDKLTPDAIKNWLGIMPSTGNINTSVTTNDTTYIVTALDNNLILQKGSKGKEVYELQRLLNQHFNAGLIKDKNFGNKTLAALTNNVNVTAITLNAFDIFIANHPDGVKPTLVVQPEKGWDFWSIQDYFKNLWN